MNSSGLHHISKRKRVSKKLELYPSNKFWIGLLDKLLLIIAIVGPLMTLPQILKIFITRDVFGLSLISWSSWALMNIPWVIYGFVHKDKPVLIAYILWFFMNLSVVIGILLYS